MTQLSLSAQFACFSIFQFSNRKSKLQNFLYKYILHMKQRYSETWLKEQNAVIDKVYASLFRFIRVINSIKKSLRILVNSFDNFVWIQI